MACRIAQARFAVMAQQEAGKLDLNSVGFFEVKGEDTHPGAFELVHVAGATAILHRKPIQSLVDEAEQARVIIRNLLRWAKEKGAK